MLGKERERVPKEKRRAAVVRVIMRKLLKGLKRIHALGLVHRDVRTPALPQSMGAHTIHTLRLAATYSSGSLCWSTQGANSASDQRPTLGCCR